MSESDLREDQELSDADKASDSAPVGKRYRYRIRFAKLGPLRYISHLDLARLWERVFRRARAPLIYSQGFNPRPKLQLASGLPLGHESTFELLDAWLDRPLDDLDLFSRALGESAPEGLKVLSIEPVDPQEPALQTVTDSATYQVILDEDVDASDLRQLAREFLARADCVRVRRDKPYDLRPLVDDLEVIDQPRLTLIMTLALSAKRGTARPDEVIEALGLNAGRAKVTRTAIELDS